MSKGTEKQSLNGGKWIVQQKYSIICQNRVPILTATFHFLSLLLLLKILNRRFSEYF